jgi:hypothetical protein
MDGRDECCRPLGAGRGGRADGAPSAPGRLQLGSTTDVDGAEPTVLAYAGTTSGPASESKWLLRALGSRSRPRPVARLVHEAFHARGRGGAAPQQHRQTSSLDRIWDENEHAALAEELGAMSTPLFPGAVAVSDLAV